MLYNYKRGLIYTGKLITEVINVSPSDVSFDTLIPFKSFSTKLYLNEIELTSADYIELNNTSLNITTLIEDNSQLIINYEPLNNIPIISHSINTYSMFKTFSSEEKLQVNQKYQLKLQIKDIQVDISFISKCTPYHTSIKKIKEDIGALSDQLSDEYINYFIYINSKELDEKIEENDISTAEGLPTYAKKWVRYKTALELVNSIYLSICGKENLLSKKIGPITLESRFRVPELTLMIKRFKDEFDKYDSYFNGSSATFISASFIKGGTSYPYPINTRNSF